MNRFVRIQMFQTGRCFGYVFTLVRAFGMVNLQRESFSCMVFFGLVPTSCGAHKY